VGLKGHELLVYSGGLYCSKVVIQSNSAGRRRSDLSLNKNVEVLVKAKSYTRLKAELERL
jgi:hypothetical protein